MNSTLNGQIAPEIVQAIITQATVQGLSVNDYLSLAAQREATIAELTEHCRPIAEGDTRPELTSVFCSRRSGLNFSHPERV